MTKLEICDNIVEELNSAFTKDDFWVIRYPSDIKDFQLSHPNGAILIKTGGVNADKPVNEVVQTQFLTIIITILAKELYEVPGLYEAEERIKQHLGFLRFENAKCYLLTETEPIQTEENFWFNEMTFILPQININE